MTFANTTPFAARDLPMVAHDGRDVVVAIVKVTVGADARPVRLGNIVRDPEAEDSSIVWPSDVCIAKRGADIVVVGDAVSSTPVASSLVSVKVRDKLLQLRIHGERVFFRGALGRIVPGDAARFTRQPLHYEKAYGGKTPQAVEWRNPVGRGVVPVVGAPAPVTEVVGGDDEPAGLGAISPHWSPRREYFGTLDAAHMRERMPLAPIDFDLRFNNVAHPQLQLDEALQPGDAVAVEGMTHDGPLVASVPDVVINAVAHFDDGTVTRSRAPMDTMVIDTEAGAFELTCRAVFALGRGNKRLRALRVEQV